VYTEEDIVDATLALTAAKEVLGYFRFYFTPFKPPKILSLPSAASKLFNEAMLDLDTRAGVLRRLNSIPAFASAFASMKG
jgi:hypothetical protein